MNLSAVPTNLVSGEFGHIRLVKRVFSFFPNHIAKQRTWRLITYGAKNGVPPAKRQSKLRLKSTFGKTTESFRTKSKPSLNVLPNSSLLIFQVHLKYISIHGVNQPGSFSKMAGGERRGPFYGFCEGTYFHKFCHSGHLYYVCFCLACTYQIYDLLEFCSECDHHLVISV